MELELWFLILLPILFAAGWFARSLDFKEKKTIADETQTLYKGVDLLLNNKQDQAVDSFIQLAKTDPDTTEMHHTLGALFRRRGEFEKAVKIHHHLAHRGDLSDKERERAEFELGNDYLKAGLWDRAEQSFRTVADRGSTLRLEARRELLSLYEQEKEWQRAIDEAQLLERQSGEKINRRVSHYYCELSHEAMLAKDYLKAASYLTQALTEDSTNIRAHMMKAQMLKVKGDKEAAVAEWRQVGQISPEYEALVIEPLTQTLIELGRRQEAESYLLRIIERDANPDELDAAIAQLAKISGAQKAIELLRKPLEEKPSLVGFERLITLRLASDPDNQFLQTLGKLLRGQNAKSTRYRCARCGFATRRFRWQCPGCHAWDSLSPVRSENAHTSRRNR